MKSPFVFIRTVRDRGCDRASGPMGVTAELFVPPDMDAAHEAWGASCGPGALAALTGRTLEQVRPHLGDFERRGYMNPTQMFAALASMKIPSGSYSSLNSDAGLFCIQFGGPWMKPGVPPRVAYRYTHWIAFRTGHSERWVYDVNGDGWEPARVWEREVAPAIAEYWRTHNPRGWKPGEGCWRIEFEVIDVPVAAGRAA